VFCRSSTVTQCLGGEGRNANYSHRLARDSTSIHSLVHQIVFGAALPHLSSERPLLENRPPFLAHDLPALRVVVAPRLCDRSPTMFSGKPVELVLVECCSFCAAEPRRQCQVLRRRCGSCRRPSQNNLRRRVGSKMIGSNDPAQVSGGPATASTPACSTRAGRPPRRVATMRPLPGIWHQRAMSPPMILQARSQFLTRRCPASVPFRSNCNDHRA